MAEERAGQAVVGVAEVGVVEDVEELGSETKPDLLGELKLALEGHVRLRGSETAQNIAPEIALLASGRRGKSGLVENFATGILGAIEEERHTRVYVRAGIEGRAISEINCANNINGRGRPSQSKTVH